MSLILGNTNIAGTQILYSTTGNNTDGAMTQNAITTELNNCVHKAENETVDGVKTFNDSIHFNSSVFIDAAAGDEGGEIELAKAPNSSLTGNVKLDVYKNRMRIFGPASNGDVRTIINADIEQNALFVPSSDKINAAISTIGINKSLNGYVKLGNGIIIQWGFVNNISSGTINFSIPFSADAKVCFACSKGIPNVTLTNTTSFSYNCYNSGGNADVWWIAVGY